MKSKNQFTFDAEITGTIEMPTLSTLLNRRKHPRAPATSNAALPSSGAPDSEPRIVPRARGRGERTALLQLDLERIARIHSGLGRGLKLLERDSETSGLFFKFSGGPDPQHQPLQGVASFGPAAQRELWRGATWNHGVTPFLWKELIREGRVEMAAHAEARGEEGLLRSAFGLREREYVTLVRVGPVHRCKGVVMVVSPQRPANLDEVAAIINGSVGVGSSAA